MSNKDNLQTSKAEITFDTRPAVIKIWIDDLPLGNTGETSKQIYQALKNVNLQNGSLTRHLDFLESLSPTLTILYPRLAKYFIGVSLPLDKKTRNVLDVTTRLLNEVLKGYRIIIKRLLTKKPFGWKKQLSLALHHSFIYKSQILCSQRLVYQPHAQGIWQEIYWCYQQASKFKLLKKRFHNYSVSDDKTSIDDEFKRLLLLSLLSAPELGLKNMREVHNLMPLWIQHAEILTQETKEKITCFTLNLLSDSAPFLIGTQKENTSSSLDKYFLSTCKLKQILTKYLTKIETGGAIKIGKNILSKTTIKALLSSWSRKHMRTTARNEGKGFVDIITSITAIHSVLQQQDQPTYDEVSDDLPDNVVNFETTLKISPLKDPSKNSALNLDYFLSNTDQDKDVWEQVYENNANNILPLKPWTETGSFKSFNFSKSILLDYSKYGYRLSVNDKTVDSLKHNELVAVREHALAPWALSQIKWLHFSKAGDVQFGLQILSHHVLPISIRYSANGGLSKPLPCLLGLDRKKLMLFIPTLPTNLNGKKLNLEHQNQHSQIQLKNKLLTTPAFDIYEIDEVQIMDLSKRQTIKQPKVIIDNSLKPPLPDSIWLSF